MYRDRERYIEREKLTRLQNCKRRRRLPRGIRNCKGSRGF